MNHVTSPSSTHPAFDTSEDNELNLVALWLKKDPKRWVAGAIAGLFAGLVMLAFGVALCAAFGKDLFYPIRVPALPFLGGPALDYHNTTAIFVGLAFHETLAMVLGVIFSHVMATNSLKALLGLGFVWGTFSWIFITNLFAHAVPEVVAAELPIGAMFFVNVVFGISLTSVAFFDRMFRR